MIWMLIIDLFQVISEIEDADIQIEAEDNPWKQLRQNLPGRFHCWRANKIIKHRMPEGVGENPLLFV